MTERPTPDDAGPFRGIRVLDMSQGYAGPYCGAILAAQGADVIKVEPPAGDWARRIGQDYGENTSFGTASNIGKRSLSVDARSAPGRELLRRLAASSDILIQSSRLGAVERLGLDRDSLSADNERLVYVSVSGFGRAGPWAARPGTDTILQGLSGFMQLNRSDSGPRRLRFSIIDAATGVYAAQQVGAALFRRERDGKGCLIDVSLLECATALQSVPMLEAALMTATGRSGGQTELTAPVGQFHATDGILTLSCTGDAMFAALARVIGHPEWHGDPELATAAGRLRRIDNLNAAVAAAVARHPLREWISRFSEAGVLCGPVYTYDEFLTDAEVHETGVLNQLRIPGLDIPVPVGRTPGGTSRTGTAPGVGEHSTDVLLEAGLTRGEIDALLANGSITQNHCATQGPRRDT